MKGIVFSVIGTIIIANTTFSQRGLEIGFDLEPQFTSIIRTDDILGSNTIYRKGKISFSYGLFISYRLNTSISLNTGIYFNPQGIKEEKLDWDGTREGLLTIENNYIRFPLAVTFNLPNESNLRLKLTFGPGFNYLLNADDNLRDIITFVDCIVKSPNDRYKKLVIDYSASFGINYPLVNNISVIADFEGVLGLSRIDKDGCINVNSRILSFGVNFGIRYSIF